MPYAYGYEQNWEHWVITLNASRMKLWIYTDKYNHNKVEASASR